MDDSPQLHISEFEDHKDMEQVEEEDIYQEKTNAQPDTIELAGQDCPKNPNQDIQHDWNSFPCQYCQRYFISKQGLERHIHIHMLQNNAHTSKSNSSSISVGLNLGQLQTEKIKPLDSGSSAVQLHNSSPASSDTSILSAGDHSDWPDEHVVSEGHYACDYCEKIFTTHINKQRHERRIHKQHLQQEETHLPEEGTPVRIFSDTSQNKKELTDSSAPIATLGNEGEQFMLDVPGNISENLSFYIDGKIVSTSTVSTCDTAEAQSGSSTFVRLDTLILDPAQISQVLNTDMVTGKEMPGQALAKRRTATPPLLPQIKTELESEVVVSSSSSSLVSSLIENLLPQNIESTIAQKERTVFLSPKLKQLLEKQDGLKPTLALIADGQKPCSPVSLSVLPDGGGKFKRRTGSPTSSTQETPTSNKETQTVDTTDCDAVSPAQLETAHSSPMHQKATEGGDIIPVGELAEKPGFLENWPPITGGNSCNQLPLDLSNTVKRNEDIASGDAALDLRLQKKTLGEYELALKVVSEAALKDGKLNTCIIEKALMKNGEQNVCLGSPEPPLVADFTIVTGPDLMTPVEPLSEGLVYGLALPPNSLAPSPASLTPVTLQPASSCTIAFASPAPHTLLPSASSLITVLAPPPPISNPSSQPVQVIAPNISPEPLVICAENALNSPECDLTTAFATSNSANLVTLSQPLDPALNLPGHVFLTDQIALNPPIVESASVSEVPFPPTITLNDPLINSYNISSNTVLIECTIALEAPGNIVPAAITLQENTAELPTPSQMLVNHIEQHSVLVPTPQTLDPTVLEPSIAESGTLSKANSLKSNCPSAVGETNPDPKPPVNEDPPCTIQEEAADKRIPTPEIPIKSPISSEKDKEENSANDTSSDTWQQTFTKNFICNVCDKLFHSMKELSHHVGDHADEWPYKCEFCVLLFGKPSALLDHRSSLHGVGKTYVCSTCTKEFVYLCNLKQHQEELHPGQQCTYTEEEKGKLRPQNYNNSTKVSIEVSDPNAPDDHEVKKEEREADVAAEELFTTIKIMASDGAKIKGPDVRLGINQHYPSFKPPPFPYHNRSPAGSMASATNFTTHNIPQTFSTAIRCTKCGKGFDNMPELHKHILICANASDKKRYTPKKNPIPLRHFAKTQNGVLSTNRLNASNRSAQSNRSKTYQDSPEKMKLKVLNKKKRLVQRVMPQRNKAGNKLSGAQADGQQEIFVCPHCSREFTMRRSRTKHMAVCPQKPKETKKRKDGGISVTKENHGHLHRGVGEKQQATHNHKTRLQTSGSGKRPTVLPAQTVLASKRSKIVAKESVQQKQETPTLTELPIVRTFNPTMRQYSRVQHSVPIKITILKPQQAAPQREEPAPTLCKKEATRATINNSEQSPTA